jgi:hypothetical protein
MSDRTQNIAKDRAPVVYFDGVIAHGAMRGAIQLELGVCVFTATMPGMLQSEIVATAHLRCGRTAALELRKAIDDALTRHAASEVVSDHATAADTPVIPLLRN